MTSTLARALKVRVPLPGRAYDVLVGEGLLQEAGAHVAERLGRRRAVVVSDDVVAPLHLDPLCRSLCAAGLRATAHVVAAGEASKSMAVFAETVAAILSAGLERDDLVIALGGGVVGDLAGFAAAVVRRGVPFVQVPTTLLAQVDSSVGGKTGINAPQGKNLVGAFHQPSLVLSDTSTLATLSERHRRAGYAEIVKMALIRDAPFFDRLAAAGERALHDDLETTIARAVEGKVAVVVNDEREAGERALLNLGHTFGHAMERCRGYDDTLVHGEAVALGVALAVRFSARLGHAQMADAERVAAHLAAVGLPTTFADVTPDQSRAFTVGGLKAAMAEDKKVKDGVIRFILLRAIGDAFLSDGVAPGALDAFLAEEGLKP